jgi:hypothetical protein
MLKIHSVDPAINVKGIKIADTIVKVFMISFILWDCEEKKIDTFNIPISESICSKSSKLFWCNQKNSWMFYFYHFKIFIFFETLIAYKESEAE